MSAEAAIPAGASRRTTDSHFIPPVVGALALVGGIVLLVVKPRRA